MLWGNVVVAVVAVVAVAIAVSSIPPVHRMVYGFRMRCHRRRTDNRYRMSLELSVG